MSKRQDRIQIAKDICHAASQYKSTLVGRTFLYVFENQYIEVIFLTSSFKHLTGVDSRLSAKDFYKNALRNQLRAEQISFSAAHPYPLCQKKLKHLSDLSDLVFTDTIMLELISTATRTYKFGPTDLNFTVCFSQDPTPNPDPNVVSPYHAYSLRDDDCFDKSCKAFEVSHVFVKKNDAHQYDTLSFHDPRYQHSDLPTEVKNKLHPMLRTQLHI